MKINVLCDRQKENCELKSKAFFKLPETRFKGTKFFARKYLITQNKIHFRQFHWPMDFGKDFWHKIFGSIKRVL